MKLEELIALRRRVGNINRLGDVDDRVNALEDVLYDLLDKLIAERMEQEEGKEE